MDWVANAARRTPAPPARRLDPSHQQRVELDAAIAGKKAAAPCVVGIVVLEDGDGSLHRIESLRPLLQQGVASGQRIRDAVLVRLHHVIWNIPSPAVHK